MPYDKLSIENVPLLILGDTQSGKRTSKERPISPYVIATDTHDRFSVQ